MRRNPSDDRNRWVEVDAEIEAETEMAVLLDVGLDEPVWVPKSCFTQARDGDIKIVEWFALRKGII